MIPTSEKRVIHSGGGVEKSIGFRISEGDSAHIMGILRDQLYSDKVMAVLREIGANAVDANIAAGRGDRPIRVSLPTIGDPCLRICDEGPGLSWDDVRQVFSQYGASTKRDSNSAIGMLGIGSKSPFAYCDSFTVTSWHGGLRSVYNAVLDESGAGRIDLLASFDSDEPSRTGLEVCVPVKAVDFEAFRDRAKVLYSYFTPPPVINLELNRMPDGTPVRDGLIIHSKDGSSSTKWIATMGNIPYRIDLTQLIVAGAEGLYKAAHHVGGVLRFPIGSLQVAASREDLKYNEATRDALITRVNRAIDDYVAGLLEGIDLVTAWEARLRVRRLVSQQLRVPPDLKHLASDYVRLPEQTPYKFSTVSWDGKWCETKRIDVRPRVRLLLRDCRRAIAGYDLTSEDIILVEPSLIGNPPGLKKLYKDVCELLKIDGIPTVMMSSLPWNDRRKTRVAADPAVAARRRAKVLCLADPRHEKPAGRWEPIEHTPGPDDIYVIIENYEAQGEDSFYYETGRQWDMFRAAGIDPPTIIAYRQTAKHPAPPTIEGTPYNLWKRNGGVRNHLMKSAEFRRIMEAWMIIRPKWLFAQHDSKADIGSILGPNHPLTLRQVAEATANEVVRLANKKLLEAAGNLSPTGTSDPLFKQYPLLTHAPYNVFDSAYATEWIDYVRMVDSFQPPVQQQPVTETQTSTGEQ